MTDEQYLERLEYCQYPMNCCICKYKNDCFLDNKKTVDLIHRQKAEIERLTKEINQRREMMQRMNCNYATELQKNAELQKQVDELTEKLGKVLNGIKADEFLTARGVEQAVKDTAKEILTDIVEGFVFSYKAKNKDWQDGYDQAMTDYDNKLKEYFKERHDVEVE